MIYFNTQNINIQLLLKNNIIIQIFFHRSVFGGSVGPNPLKGETSGTQYYEGIRVRATSPQVTYPSQTAVGTNTAPIPAANATPVKVLPVQQRTIKSISPAPDSTALDNPASGPPRTPAPASPILKAQLSAPPKPPSSISNTATQSQNPVTKVDSKSQVGPSPKLSTILSTTHDLGSYFGYGFTMLS